MKQFFGKYRGKVVNDVDIKQQGCLQVSVPAVFGYEVLAWAYPCVPYAGLQAGFCAIPPVGANVWVEFEAGDPKVPIWTGCFWGATEMPAMALLIPPTVPGITMQTPLGTGVTLTDLPGPSGGIILKTATGASLMMNDSGVILSNGRGATITMFGKTVDINQTALTVL